jgi:hypothetical protein
MYPFGHPDHPSVYNQEGSSSKKDPTNLKVHGMGATGSDRYRILAEGKQQHSF